MSNVNLQQPIASAAFKRAYMVLEDVKDRIPDTDVWEKRSIPLTNGQLSVSTDNTYNLIQYNRSDNYEYHDVMRTDGKTKLNWEGPATYNLLTYFLLMGVNGAPDWEADGIKNPTLHSDRNNYTKILEYTFNPSFTIPGIQNQYKDFFQSASIFFGDNINGFYIPSVIVTKITLTGSLGEAVKLSVDMEGDTLYTADPADIEQYGKPDTYVMYKQYARENQRRYLDYPLTNRGGNTV